MRDSFKILIIIICVLLVAIISIMCLCKQRNYEQFLASDPKLNNILEKFHDFFEKEKKWEYPLERLNDKNTYRDIIFYRGDKSYTLNKETVYICLKNEHGQYYDENMLIYVIAHEISHVLCPEVGHTELFFEINEKL